MNNTPVDRDSDLQPPVSTDLEMAQTNVALSSRQEKKTRKKQKRRNNAPENNDIDHDLSGGTSSMKNSSLERDSLQEYRKGKKHKKRHITLENNDIDHDAQEGGSMTSSDLTNIKHVENDDVNTVSEVAELDSTSIKKNLEVPMVNSSIAENLSSFQESSDTGSMKKRDNHSKVDVISLKGRGIKTYRRKKQVKTYHRKTKNLSNSSGNSLEPIKEEGISSSMQVVQNSSMRETSSNRSDEALASGLSENKLEEEPAVGHGTSLQVVEDISLEQASCNCSDGEPASEETKNRLKMKNLKETINEDSFVKDVSMLDRVEHFGQGNRGKLKKIKKAVRSGDSIEENFGKSTAYCKDKASDDASGCDPSCEHLEQKNVEIQTQVEHFGQGNRGKLKKIKKAVRGGDSIKENFGKSKAYCEDKASDDASGCDPSCEHLEQKNVEIQTQVEHFGQGNRGKLKKIKKAVRGGDSIEENFGKSTAYCEDKASDDTSGCDPSCEHLEQKNVEIQTQVERFGQGNRGKLKKIKKAVRVGDSIEENFGKSTAYCEDKASDDASGCDPSCEHLEQKNVEIQTQVEHFGQGNRGKLKKIKKVVRGGDSIEENFGKSTAYCADKASDDASGCDPSCEHLEQKNVEIPTQMEEIIPPPSHLGVIKDDVSILINKEDLPPQIMHSSPERALIGRSRRKLLILDVNGLLADIVPYVPDGYKVDITIAKKAVFKRPFCDDFLQFCFERFDVGVWSSRTKRNVDRVLDFLMGDTKQKLLFCWDQFHCTDTGYNTIENRDKPLVLKELKKLWEKSEPDLPWEKGDYNESNTLLLDDSPYKALRNPPHTAIFPYTYRYKDIKDNSLGPGGDLRVYLEGLALAENVQKYVEQNPFGQRPITKSNLSWGFYVKVIGTDSYQPEDDAINSSACQQ